MRVWIWPEDLPCLDFDVPLHPADENTLIGLHLSLKIGYVNSELYFCCASKTIADLANTIFKSATTSLLHPLSALADTPPPVDNDAYIRTTPLALNVSLTTLYACLLLKSQANPLH